MGGWFTEGEKIEAEPLIPDWQMDLRKGLPGEFDKLRGFSPLEKRGESLMMDILGSPGLMDSEIGGATSAQILKTLRGEYDPYTSEYYKSLRRGIEREGDVSRGRISRSAQKAGMLQSTPRLMREARLEDEMVGAKGDILAKLFESERGRAISTLDPAMRFMELGETQPLRRAGAAYTYGGLPRSIEEKILAGKTGVAGMSTPYGVKNLYGPSPMEDIMGMGTDVLSAYLTGGGSLSSGAKPQKYDKYGIDINAPSFSPRPR